MFSLPRLDAVDAQDETDDDFDAAYGPAEGTRHGVHFETVLLACQIITGNTFDTAYLSYDRNGYDRVRMSQDGILMRSHYWLHVPQVTPNFREWRFPASLPRSWQSLAPTRLDPQSSCIISGSRMIDIAHLIPRAQEQWYTDNAMFDYTTGSRSVGNSEENTCRLRPDLHRVFDSRAFALVPKRDGNGQRHLVVHFFSTVKDVWDTALDIHNRRAHSLETVAVEFLFARFALTVFACIKDFILRGKELKIAITQRARDTSGCPAWITSVVKMDRMQRKELYGGGGSRDSSPTKRSRNTESQAGESDERISKRSIDDELEDADSEESRGRSRVRSWVLANAAELERYEERKPKRRRMNDGTSPPPLTTSLTSGTPSKLETDEPQSAGSDISGEYDYTKDHAGRSPAKGTNGSTVILEDSKVES
ncbi:hypothetical protein MRS44_018667 [Fusarium solani]|uniref:uncharacterized protein n=1 Tax=Fusarium solani TaxID=169388 RepID=UPI0032C3E4E1|nr:hypothetical protein MRS44_018667 [Fusarium solani]